MLLVPSWEEPFGRVVAEGMAAGVPVVATNHGGPDRADRRPGEGFLAPSRSRTKDGTSFTIVCRARPAETE